MRLQNLIFGIAMGFGILTLTASAACAGALPGVPPGKMNLTALIEHLEERGYDVSGIRSALEAGDNATARNLLKQFMQERRGNNTAPPEMRSEMNRSAGITRLLEQLEERGCDVSTVRAAIETEDRTAIRTAMEQLAATCDMKFPPCKHMNRTRTKGVDDFGAQPPERYDW